MRILFVIDGLPGGGAEKVVLTLAAQFLRDGDRVSLISLRDVCEYPLPEGLDYQVVADRCRKPWRKLTELSRRARQLDAAVVRAEQQGQFDLVLSNLHKTDRIVARSRALRERNVWFCLHGVFSASYLGHRTGFDRWMKQQKIKRIYQGRNVVTVSDAVGRDLVEEFALRPAQLKTIYNPFDITALRAEAEADSERPDGDYLIHVGRFHPGKRHDRLLEAYAQSGIDAPLVLEQENQGVSVARNTGLAAASGKYLAFPDIDDKLYPGMYRTLLEMAEKEHLDIATCNGTYVYEKRRESHPIFPLDRLPSTDVLPGHVWLKQALDSRKFLHVTWLNIYRHDFIRQHHFHFEPGLRHQDIPWTTEALLAAERVQYTSQQFYDYYIHSESVSHKPDNDDTLMRSARHYMKILEMLEAINQRYPDKVRHIAACRWQIAKEGLGIIHTFDSMKDESKKHVIINEFFDRGIWRLIWKNACTFRLRWRLGRRYLRIKRYRHAG
ncbi:TPA: glycosyltransferase [Klebsiella pneumoniae]|nr:glycosyltransferase [Klebsiella pneumoniae]